MAKENITPPFANGYWVWDDTTNSLAFISRDLKEAVPGLALVSGPTPTKNERLGLCNIRFKDAIDNLGQATFRRQFQRRIKPNEPQVVTIQDIKDVAIFTAERQDLTAEFIDFMHTKKMDEFLRTLIVYFQFFFQVWDNLQLRREEAKRKLRQPIVTVLENVVRDNLADLRSMVARNYGYIIMGLDETRKHYHLLGANSLSDKDRHLYESLLSMAARIVWIALLRKNFPLIEMELNRIFRTKLFNIMERLRKSDALKTKPDEDRVLFGKAYRVEKKLKHRSPAVQEIIFDSHEYKMLAIGHLRVEPVEDRIAYLEAAYTAPEELLFSLKVGVGILGLSKDYLNPILMPKEGMGKKIHIPFWKVPVMETSGAFEVTETLPKTPPRFTETELAQSNRKTQCKLWRMYVAGVETHDEKTSALIESGSSILVSIDEEA